jgi:exopolyphosphatase/guanosine-5'-triphosphate,3'-diphosphate pyrophosphatase
MDRAWRHGGGTQRNFGLTERDEVYGAVDLGTNNCRLLVALAQGQGFRVIDAFSRIVRLGEGMSASGQLSQAAMDRTLKALDICADKMRRRRVTRSRAVATEACRQAANGERFLARVRARTGIELEVISNREEAHLGLRGCLPLLDGVRPHALIFDIGGGSTEISWLELAVDGRPAAFDGDDDHHLNALHTMPNGVVNLAERYGGREVSPAVYDAMVAEMLAALAPFEATHGLRERVAADSVQMLGTSGTVTTLTGVHKNLPRYDRAQVDGAELDFETVSHVIARIAAMSYQERAAQPSIGRERADLVIAGCAILDAICRTWPVGRLRVADRGLREGILFNLMRQGGDGPSPSIST